MTAITPPQVALQIAERSLAAASSAGLMAAHYPNPGNLPVLPALVIWWTGFTNLDGGDSTSYMAMTFKGQLFTNDSDVPSAINSVDGLVIPILDAWHPRNNTDNWTLGYTVDGCTLDAGDLSKAIPFAGQPHYGGELFWTVQARR